VAEHRGDAGVIGGRADPVPTTAHWAVVEVFADVCCPFTHVGLRRFVAARAGADLPVRLRVRAWPLELVNGHPLDPGHVAEEVEALTRTVARDLFQGFAPARFPATSLPALALAAAAYERSLEVGEEVSLALRDALFETGLDIADPATLAAVADRYGLEAPPVGAAAPDPRVLADYEEGRRRGVTGSPHFFVGEAGLFCPSLQVARDAGGAFVVRDDPVALDELLARCRALVGGR